MTSAIDRLQTCRCACCGESLAGQRVNLVSLRRRAEWEHPVGGNVLTGDGPTAIAVACDECVESEPPAELTEVVEFRGERIVYHDVDELQPLGPEPTHLIFDRGGEQCIHCLVCQAISFHPDDVINKYCARCQQFHPIGGSDG